MKFFCNNIYCVSFLNLQQSRTDKDIMRPLYDRYRAIKRACGKSSTRESTKDVTRHTQEESGLNTSEPLPTVTLLQSSITLVSVHNVVGVQLDPLIPTH